MPNGHDQGERDLWDAVNGIRISQARMEATMSRMEALQEAHHADPAIHTRPPCEYARSISARMWAAVAAAALAAASALWETIQR